MYALETGMTKTLKGCLQSEVQTHSLTEDSRLTTALQRQHEATPTWATPWHQGRTGSHHVASNRAFSSGLLFKFFFFFFLIPVSFLKPWCS